MVERRYFTCMWEINKAKYLTRTGNRMKNCQRTLLVILVWACSSQTVYGGKEVTDFDALKSFSHEIQSTKFHVQENNQIPGETTEADDDYLSTNNLPFDDIIDINSNDVTKKLTDMFISLFLQKYGQQPDENSRQNMNENKEKNKVKMGMGVSGQNAGNGDSDIASELNDVVSKHNKYDGPKSVDDNDQNGLNPFKVSQSDLSNQANMDDQTDKFNLPLVIGSSVGALPSSRQRRSIKQSFTESKRSSFTPRQWSIVRSLLRLTHLPVMYTPPIQRRGFIDPLASHLIG